MDDVFESGPHTTRDGIKYNNSELKVKWNSKKIDLLVFLLLKLLNTLFVWSMSSPSNCAQDQVLYHYCRYYVNRMRANYCHQFIQARTTYRLIYRQYCLRYHTTLLISNLGIQRVLQSRRPWLLPFCHFIKLNPCFRSLPLSL